MGDQDSFDSQLKNLFSKSSIPRSPIPPPCPAFSYTTNFFIMVPPATFVHFPHGMYRFFFSCLRRQLAHTRIFQSLFIVRVSRFKNRSRVELYVFSAKLLRMNYVTSPTDLTRSLWQDFLIALQPAAKGGIPPYRRVVLSPAYRRVSTCQLQLLVQDDCVCVLANFNKTFLDISCSV